MTAVTTKNKQPEAAATEAVRAAVKCRIHFADGNKGGVGKSFLARTLYQCLLDRGVPVIGVETDIDSPDFRGIYEEVELARFSEDEAVGEQANWIANWAIEEQKSIVVNLPATVHKPFSTWLKQYKILDALQAVDIEMVKWFVCTGEYDSMKSLGNSLQAWGDRIPHVVVKNLKYSDWGFFDTDEEMQALLKQYDCPVIELPKLPQSIASRMLQQRLTFEAAQQYRDKAFGVIQQSAVKGYLKDAAAAFASTGLV
jgi:hypothetical protein